MCSAAFVHHAMLDTRRRFLCACSGVLTLFPCTGHAADSWMGTDPAQWVPADIQAILHRSSWVKGVNPELSPTWLRSLEKSGKRVGAAEGVRDKRTLTEFTVVVRWESGLPVRLARKGTPVPEYAAAHYVLSVSRMPFAFMAAMVGGAQAKDRPALAQQMLQSSSLQWGGKAPIPADHAEWTESDFEPRIMISFPQGSQPLESSDGVVTFVSQMGFLLLRASFPLRKMVYRGKLEL
jgi:hypothetical protein